MSGFKVGDRVRCEREAPAKGSRYRYSGRTGVVRTLNHDADEIGVTFTRNAAERYTWFLPSELKAIGKATARRARPESPSRGKDG